MNRAPIFHRPHTNRKRRVGLSFEWFVRTWRVLNNFPFFFFGKVFSLTFCNFSLTCCNILFLLIVKWHFRKEGAGKRAEVGIYMLAFNQSCCQIHQSRSRMKNHRCCLKSRDLEEGIDRYEFSCSHLHQYMSSHPDYLPNSSGFALNFCSVFSSSRILRSASSSEYCIRGFFAVCFFRCGDWTRLWPVTNSCNRCNVLRSRESMSNSISSCPCYYIESRMSTKVKP